MKVITTLIMFLILSINTILALEIRGKVVDYDTEKPIAGATIKILNSLKGTYSKSDGSFIVRVKDFESLGLITSFIGYERDTILIDKSNLVNEIIIRLRQKDVNTGEVVVTANKKVQSIQEVPISMSVISNQEIVLRNSTDVDKILNYIPGIKMNGDQVSIRGTSGFAFGVGSRVALLIDGMPVLSGDQGDMKFDLIPSFIIDRVEVVKGAGSALYGSSALGGVINLITPDLTKDNNLKFKIYSGIYTEPKYNDWKMSSTQFKSGTDFSYYGKKGDLSYLLAGRVLSDESYREFDDRLNYSLFSKVNFNFNNNNLKFIISYAANDHADWVYWKSLNEATKPPDGTDINLRVVSKKVSLFLNDRIVFENETVLDVKLGYYNTDFKNNAKAPEYRQSNANSFFSELQLSKKVFKNLFSTQGLTFNYNDVNSSIYSDNQQLTAAGYWQMEWSGIKNLILTGGIRLDYEKTNGSEKNIEFSPKFGANYKLTDDLNIRASLGKGFRTATIAEKFASFRFGPFKVKPNVNLIPEENYSAEIGLNYEFQFGNTLNSVDFAIFQNNLSNMIEPSFINENGEPYIKFQNIQDAIIRGFEIDIKSLMFGFVSFNSSLTYLDSKDLNTHSELKYRSKWQSTNSISFDFNYFKVQSDYRFLSKSTEVDDLLNLFISDADARVNAHIVDFRLIFNMKNYIDYDFNLMLNIENAFDYYYTEYPGNLAPVRYISLILTGAI